MGYMRALLFLTLCWFAASSSPARAASAIPGGEVMTNEKVIMLFNAKLDPEIIIQMIRDSRTALDASANGLVKLSEAGVPGDIIAAIINKSREDLISYREKILNAIRNITNTNTTIRDQALAFLEATRAMAIPMLKESLVNRRLANMRGGAALGLAWLECVEATPDILALMTDQEEFVRICAAEALFRLRDPSALEAARAAVRDNIEPGDGFLRLLGYWRDARSSTAIQLRMLQDPDPLARAQAAWAIGEIGIPGGREDIETLLATAQEAPDVRIAAVRALTKFRDDASLPILITACKLYGDHNIHGAVREEILRSFGNYSPKPVVPFLIEQALDLPRTKLTPAEQDATLSSLRRLTFKNFGLKRELWLKWLDENINNLPAKPIDQIVASNETRNPPSALPRRSTSAPMPAFAAPGGTAELGVPPATVGGDIMTGPAMADSSSPFILPSALTAPSNVGTLPWAVEPAPATGVPASPAARKPPGNPFSSLELTPPSMEPPPLQIPSPTSAIPLKTSGPTPATSSATSPAASSAPDPFDLDQLPAASVSSPPLPARPPAAAVAVPAAAANPAPEPGNAFAGFTPLPAPPPLPATGAIPSVDAAGAASSAGSNDLLSAFPTAGPPSPLSAVTPPATSAASNPPTSLASAPATTAASPSFIDDFPAFPPTPTAAPISPAASGQTPPASAQGDGSETARTPGLADSLPLPEAAFPASASNDRPGDALPLPAVAAAPANPFALPLPAPPTSVAPEPFGALPPPSPSAAGLDAPPPPMPGSTAFVPNAVPSPVEPALSLPNPGFPTDSAGAGSTSITRATTASATDTRAATVPGQPQNQNPPLTPDNQSATSNTTNDLATIWLAPPRPEDIPILEEVIGDSPRLPGSSTEPYGGDLAGAVPARLDNAGYPPAPTAAAPAAPTAFPYAGPDRRASLPPATPAAVGESAPIVDPLMSALVSAPPAATETPTPAPFPYPGPAAATTTAPGVSGLPTWSPDNPALLPPAGSPDNSSSIIPAAASSAEPVQTTLPGRLPSADAAAIAPALPPAPLGADATATTSLPFASPMNMDFPAPAGMPTPSGTVPAAASSPAISPALPGAGNLNNDFPAAGSALPTPSATTALPVASPSGIGTAGSTTLDPGIPVEFGIAMPSGTVGTVVVTPPGPGVSSIGSEPRAASIVPPAPLPPTPAGETAIGNRAGVSASDFGGTATSSSPSPPSPAPRGRWSVGDSGSSSSSTVTFTPSASDTESKRRNTVSTPPPPIPSSSNFGEPSPAPSRSGSGRRPRDESLGEMPPLLGEGL